MTDSRRVSYFYDAEVGNYHYGQGGYRRSSLLIGGGGWIFGVRLLRKRSERSCSGMALVCLASMPRIDDGLL
jgi:hypothetical protein